MRNVPVNQHRSVPWLLYLLVRSPFIEVRYRRCVTVWAYRFKRATKPRLPLAAKLNAGL